MLRFFSTSYNFYYNIQWMYIAYRTPYNIYVFENMHHKRRKACDLQHCCYVFYVSFYVTEAISQKDKIKLIDFFLSSVLLLLFSFSSVSLLFLHFRWDYIVLAIIWKRPSCRECLSTTMICAQWTKNHQQQ